jgi:dTMP kinase
MALFITFEGGEGCGKSVQARKLYRRLKQLAIPSLITREPGGTLLGQKLRRWLKWTRDSGVSPLSELLLFNAARSQLVSEVLKPNMDKGKTVICDRYADSTTAYQSYGRRLNREMVIAINNAATSSLTPDLTVLLDISPEDGLARKSGQQPDRFEQETVAFHQRVREGYLRLAKAEPRRFLVIDATRPKEEIAALIWQRVSKILPKQKGV